LQNRKCIYRGETGRDGRNKRRRKREKRGTKVGCDGTEEARERNGNGKGRRREGK